MSKLTKQGLRDSAVTAIRFGYHAASVRGIPLEQALEEAAPNIETFCNLCENLPTEVMRINFGKQANGERISFTDRRVYVIPQWIVDTVKTYIRDKDSYGAAGAIGHLNQVAYIGEKIVAVIAAEDSKNGQGERISRSRKKPAERSSNKPSRSKA